jgi:16S rRNA (guanine966-N2)-methyltransferase
VAGLRPTPDRVRETVFNWLGQTLYGKRCLDLFSGSGALGFEAASRGAESVDLVENNRTAFRALQDNQKKLACANMALHCMDGLEFARLARGRYDVIFLDPPFGSDLLLKALPLLADKLEEGGLVYVESGEAFEPDAGWQVVKSARAGKVRYQLLQHLIVETGHEAPT